MSTLWQDSVIAMFAAIGIVATVWLVGTALFAPGRRRHLSPVLMLLPASGDAVTLEFTVRQILQEQNECGHCPTLLIVDCGLTEEGLRLSCLLCRKHRNLELCKLDELPKRVSGERGVTHGADRRYRT